MSASFSIRTGMGIYQKILSDLDRKSSNVSHMIVLYPTYSSIDRVVSSHIASSHIVSSSSTKRRQDNNAYHGCTTEVNEPRPKQSKTVATGTPLLLKSSSSHVHLHRIFSWQPQAHWVCEARRVRTRPVGRSSNGVAKCPRRCSSTVIIKSV